jgi:hypothetical protein
MDDQAWFKAGTYTGQREHRRNAERHASSGTRAHYPSEHLTPCSSVKVSRRFGGLYRLRLQDRRISRELNERESRWQAEQSANRNFVLYRKQEVNGRVAQFLLSHTCDRMKPPAHIGSHTSTERTNRRREDEYRTALVLALDASFLLSLFFYPEDGGLCSFETSVEFRRTTGRYIPEDRTLHNHRWENLKSYMVAVYERAKTIHALDPLWSA